MKKIYKLNLVIFIIILMYLIVFNMVAYINNTSSIETNNMFKNDVYGVESGDTTKFIAHRGATNYAPENTLPSYEVAGKQGFWGAECDIVCTKDMKWVLMHDSTVDRTTNGSGAVYNMTLDQVKKLNVDSGNNVFLFPGLKVPTLEEYLKVCKKNKLVPVIEIKEGINNNYDSLISILKDNNIINNCIIISFDYNILKEIRKLDSDVEMQLLIAAPISPEIIKLVKELGKCGVDTSKPTKEGVNLAIANGVIVNCWLINDINMARNLEVMGVNQITSNWISKIK